MLYLHAMGHFNPDNIITNCHIIENTMLNGCCIRLDGSLRMPPK